MKTTTTNFAKLFSTIIVTTVFLMSCASSMEEKSKQEAAYYTQSDSMLGGAKTSNSNSKNNKQLPKPDSTRVFVRTADMYFKVKDVKQSTFEIEKIVTEHNGYVTTSNLESTENYKTSTRISKDTMLDEKYYTVHSDIVLRVPNEQLDNTLTKIADLIDYLDHRKIYSDDVTKLLASSTLLQKRIDKHNTRVEKTIHEKGKKLNSTIEAEDNLLDKQGIADESKLSASETWHDVNYSTVKISIYQKETIKKEVYAFSLPTEPYKPNFGSQFVSALSEGGEIFGAILLFFIRLWPIALLMIGALFLVKFVVKRKWIS